MTKEPRIYLAVDNCFASKRWTRPREWMQAARDAGVLWVEASADNECDPLYTTPDYIRDWMDDVRRSAQQTGVGVGNLYSGHGTYSTLGLAHTDMRVRQHMLDHWLKPMADTACALGAGLGFFCHAFPDAVLQSPDAYAQAYAVLCGNLMELARHSAARGLRYLSLEQMYSPHQIPWTIAGARKLLRDVWAGCGAPLYLTIDTGHQSGQRRFLRPGEERLLRMMQGARKSGALDGWVGPASAQRLILGAARDAAGAADWLREVNREMDRHPYLFAREDDGDPYRWLEELGGYSPIIHLQQTDGSSSRHLAFTAANNRTGIVDPAKILRALAKCYARPREDAMPPMCGDIFLTLELFAGTAQYNSDVLSDVSASAQYLRRYIPRDGLLLGELLEALPSA